MIGQLEKHPFPARPIQTLFVSGDDREVGRQHAEQVKDILDKGMPQFYFSFWQRMASSKSENPLRKWTHAAGRFFLDNVIVKRMHRQVPSWAFERIRGVCDASNRPFQEMTTALILPDLFPLFEVWLARWAPKLFIPPEFPALFGCSSYFLKGDHFYWGRNLDFPGVSYWDRYPVIQVTRLKGRIPYIGFSSAGIPFGGITGINEERLSVGLHQHYSRAGRLDGQLPFLIAEQILTTCRTLNQAVELLKSQRVATSWAFLLGDGKTKEAAVFECHSNASALNPLSGNILSHANYFQTISCRKEEFATSARMNWDNFCRKSRVDELLERAGSDFSPAVGVKALSDHFDPYWAEEKILNRTVSQVYNIQSLLIDFDSMAAWCAEGDSPIHLRDFTKFDLGELFAGRTGRTEQRLEGYRFQEAGRGVAKENFIRSFVHAFDGDYALAERYLEEALARDYTAEGGLIRGVLHLKSKRFGDAKHSLSQAAAFIEEKAARLGKESLPPEYFEILIYLARAHDLLGDCAKVGDLYDRVASHPDCRDPNLKRIARERRPYRLRHLERILMPYSSYIPFM